MNTNKFVKIGGILIVLLALAALIGSSLTFAQDETPPDDTVTIPEDGGPKPDRFGPGGPRGNREPLIDRGVARELLAEELGVTVEALDAAKEAAIEAAKADGTRPNREEIQALIAAELGISVEELDAAQTAVREAMFAQLVEDGSITQEQLDEMLAMKELREIAKDIFSREDAQAATAEALGLTVEELAAAHEDGTRLPQLAEEQGVDLETVMTAVSDARTAAIDQAVADGTLTQEQADLLQSQEGPRFGGPRGNCGPRDGGPRGGGQQGGQFGPGSGNSNFAPGAPTGQGA
jgi:uncharacterized protein YidB (DUF937 family)